MKNILGVSFLIFIVLLAGSCVSKKKYLAMETLKNQYVKQATNLQKENDELKDNLTSAEKEFDEFNQNLRYSNSVKDGDIAEVTQQLKDMEENFNRAQSELSRTQDLYKDQRFYNTQASNEITRLEFAIEQLKRDTVSLNYSLKLAKQKNDQVQKRLMERVDQLNEKNSDIAKLQNEMAAKDEAIKEVENQLTEQKAKIDAINTAFIELRKDMLRAKASNTIIDPGTDPNVAKISKALGHY
ncbi:hypothetical protein ACE01N_08055 [Saccharicrinis sp. FJH2]|uniref:hypothetical protein n=2 Tax=unclassified Saccharicrinis TaxID=2646859 RepID=UPI0035F3A4B4